MIYIDYVGHLISDKSLIELHCFAKDLGLKREWFQNHPRHPHYDVTTERMIKKAVAIGAMMVDRREIINIINKKCTGGAYDKVRTV